MARPAMPHPASGDQRSAPRVSAPEAHALLWLPGPGKHHGLLDRAADFCVDAGARLSVVLPLAERPTPDGCCGIPGDHWTSLLTDHARDDLEHAVQRCSARRCAPQRAAVRAGPDDPTIVLSAAAAWGCEVIIVGVKRRRWSADGTPARAVAELQRITDRRIVELPAQ